MVSDIARGLVFLQLGADAIVGLFWQSTQLSVTALVIDGYGCRERRAGGRDATTTLENAIGPTRRQGPPYAKQARDRLERLG